MKLPLAWILWLATVLVLLSITRNPLYLLIILLCILGVGLSLWKRISDYERPFSPWKFAGWIILLATVFNALTSHFGETVLFSIPGKIPLLTGKVTLEAVVYGATNGLILTGMLAGFTVLNMALPIRDLISLIPRAFFPMAVVTSIAVTYLPTTIRQFRQVREAQAVRGHQMRSLRDWLPLLMPLLVGGLEHAMQLAEAMTARGFASSSPVTGARRIYPRLFLLLGVVLIAVGWIIELISVEKFGLIILLVGVSLIILGVWSMGNQSPRSRYHQAAPTWVDDLGIMGALITMAIFLLPIPAIARETLYYDPYPVLHSPGFSPFLGVILLGLLIPCLSGLKGSHHNEK